MNREPATTFIALRALTPVREGSAMPVLRPLSRLLLLLLALAAAAQPAERAAERRAREAQAKEAARVLDAQRAVRQGILAERLLQHFSIGVEAPADWHRETQQKNGCRFATNMQYLSGGTDGVTPNNRWLWTGTESQLDQAEQAGIVCWFTWYMLAQSKPAEYKPGPAEAAPRNARDAVCMKAYWLAFKELMTRCGARQGGAIVVQIEPDEWGHLLMPNAMDPTLAGVVLVGSSGVPELAGLPDTVAGWAAGFRTLRDRYAPRVLLCANPSAWRRDGEMSGEGWAKVFQTCGVTPAGGWDLFVAQLHDWDHGLKSSGANAKWPPYAEADVVTYHRTWSAMCQWIKALHDGTGMWCALWQLPVGNAAYATCDGSEGHGMDGIAEALLEGYPRNDLAARMAASGCCLWIFSHGGGGASAWDARQDGVTNPMPAKGSRGLVSTVADDDGGYLRFRAAEYFKGPVPILAKPRKADKEKAKGRAEPAPTGTEAVPTGTEAADDVADDTGTKAKDAPPPAPRRTVALVDKAARDYYAARLRARVSADLADRRVITFTYTAMRAKARIDRIDQGVVTLRIDGSELTMPWRALPDADLLELGRVVLRDREAADQGVLAFLLLLNGKVEEGEERLRQAPGHDAEVRKAFTISDR